MDPFSKPRNRRTNQGYNRVGAGPEYEGIPNADGSVMEYSKTPYSRGTISTLIGMTALIGVIAIVGLIIASILAGSNFIKQGSSPMFDSITVSGTVNTTTLLSESIGFGSVDVQNLTTVNHTSTTIATGHLNADNVWVNSVNSTTVSATTVSATNVNSATVSTETVSATSVNATTVSTTTVMTDNVMHNVLSVSTNDTMPATHGHVLLEGVAVVVTLPAFPLTAFKGKTFTVCNSDNTDRKLVLPDGNYWLPNTYFTQIFFNEGACCVTFSVTDENRVHIVGDRDNRCFSFCTADSLFCVDPQRPDETSVFGGWWGARTPGPVLSGIGGFSDRLHSVIRAEVQGPYPAPPYHFNLRVYCGTGRTDVAECTDPDMRAPSPGNVDPSTNNREVRQGVFMVDSTTMAINDVFFDGILDAFGTNNTLTFYLEEDEKTMVLQFTNALVIPSVQNFVLEKMSPPKIRGYGALALEDTMSVNDLAFQLRSLRNIREQLGGEAGKNGGTDGYIGYAASNELLETLISDGVSRNANIYSVRSTIHPNTPATGTELLTTIRTTVPHGVSPFSTVSFSGFTGAWSVLNTGDYKVVMTGLSDYETDINNDFVDYHVDPAQSSIKFELNIVFDSSGMFNNFTGTPVIHVSHGPVTSSMEYREWCDVAVYWMHESLTQSLHNIFRQFYDPVLSAAPFFVHNTFAEFQNAMDTVSSVRGAKFTRTTEQASEFYINAARNIGGSPSIGKTRGYVPVNDPYLGNLLNDVQDPTGIYDRFVMMNYLEEVHVPYWKQVGAPDPTNGFQILSSFINAPGDGSTGRSFEGTTAPFGDLPPAGYSFLHPDAPQNCEPGTPLPFSCIFGIPGGYGVLPPHIVKNFQEDFFFGLVNQNFTDGRKIGYIRLRDMQQGDVPGLMNIYDMLPDDLPDSPRFTDETLARVTAPMMYKMVTEWECDRVILDIRSNNGGFPHMARVLSHAFGDDQEGFGNRFVTTNNDDFSVVLDPFTFRKTDAQEVMKSRQYMFRSYASAANPGTTVSDGYVAILTDIASASGGDMFPNYFVGENEDKQLGTGVQSFLFGEVDGRLLGSTGPTVALPVSGTGSRIMAGGTYPFPIAYSAVENGGLLYVHAKSNRTSMVRSPGLACSAGTSVSGRSGGNCFSNLYEDTVHYDLGYVTPHPDPRLPNDNRVDPIPSDPDTWRGRWEEDVIRTLSALPLPVKKKRDATQSVPQLIRHERTISVVPAMACTVSDNVSKRTSHHEFAVDIDMTYIDDGLYATTGIDKAKLEISKLYNWFNMERSHGGFCQDTVTGNIKLVDAKLKMMPNITVHRALFNK